MAFEQKDNSGSLFVNDKRQPGSQQPDRSGSALIDGVEYWVSGWIKKKQDGSAWLSLAFKQKEQRPPKITGGGKASGSGGGSVHGAMPGKSSGFDDMDDDIPF